MKWKRFPVVFIVCFSGMVHMNNPMAASYTKLYVFGDSYSDMGAGYVDGNGPTAVVYLAQHLGIPLTHSQDPQANSKSINFAVSGGQSGWGKGQAIKGGGLLGLGMADQGDDFCGRVRAGKVSFQPESTLFFIAGGLNDAALPTDTTLSNLTALVTALKGAGARHFLLAILPEKIPAFSGLAKRLNPAYRKLVPELRSSLRIDIRLSDWGVFFDEVITHPGAYGIINTKDKCAGRAIFGEDTTQCASPEAYFYYHEGHPSTAVHKVVGEMLYREFISR